MRIFKKRNFWKWCAFSNKDKKWWWNFKNILNVNILIHTLTGNFLIRLHVRRETRQERERERGNIHGGALDEEVWLSVKKELQETMIAYRHVNWEVQWLDWLTGLLDPLIWYVYFFNANSFRIWPNPEYWVRPHWNDYFFHK